MQERSLLCSEMVPRVVENLACHLAERHQGRITTNHLIPYLPLPLEWIRTCLDLMTDGHMVYAATSEQIRVYEFPAYRERPAKPGALSVPSCLSCHATFAPKRKRILCAACTATLRHELRRLAKRTNWVEQALQEHEILYLAGQHAGPLPANTLASRSRTTLRETRQTLDRLSLDGYLCQDVDAETGVITYLFPEVEYPRRCYRENQGIIQSCVARGTASDRRKKGWLLSGLGVLILAGLSFFFLLPSTSHVSTPFRQEIRHAPQQVVRSVASAPARPSQEDTAVPLYGQAYHDSAMKDATPIEISIRKHGFVPVGPMLATRWNQTTSLSPDPPAGIIKAPSYRGGRQLYGAFALGTMDDKTYPFVLDLVSGPHPELYFDTNHNGDLTDDGGPLTNQGNGVFATNIQIPFAQLLKEVRFPGLYTLWFFVNDSHWQKGVVAHYSQTQLRGKVTLQGRTYTAYIVDTGGNDADFTNDGIAVDLNGDGKIDYKGEVFRPDKVARIQGQDHVFKITW
jgi:hypothetical protein